MSIRIGLFSLALTMVSAGVAFAQFPLLDMMANNVIQKYQSATCEQLWEARGKPKSQQEQELIQLLRAIPKCVPPSSTRSRGRSPIRCSIAA